MLEMNGIELAETKPDFSIELALNTDGLFRYCVDYSKLNAETKGDTYLVIRMEHYFDSLGYAFITCTLEAKAAIGKYR